MRNAPRFCLLALMFFTFSHGAIAADPAAGHPGVATASTANLKQYMAKFGSMFASLEIIQLKEKKPDWPAIDIAVKDMSDTLAQLQKADKANAYKEYTDVLAAGMVELREKSAKRDISFFRSMDKISEACFKCHAAHRPGDYLIPEKTKDQLSQEKPASAPN